MISATNTALLIGLKDPGNGQVWEQFFTRYQPLLISFARRLGLNQTDAEDAAQEALIAFATCYQEGKYDREKGRLRTWLSAITRNKVRNIQERRARECPVGERASITAMIEQIADEASMSELWEAEWSRPTDGPLA